MSITFFGKRFKLTQPDGTKLDAVGWGNQHHAVFETLDGYTLHRDPGSGYYEYAVPDEDDLKASGIVPGAIDPRSINLARSLRASPEVARARARESGLPRGGTRWEQRRANAKAVSSLRTGILAAPPRRETVGTFVGLVLLVEFPDVPQTIGRDEVEAYCNQQGYSGFGNNGSVYDYFLEQSTGKLEYTNIVTQYYRAKYNKDYYTNRDVEYGVRARELIREALAHWKAKGFDFSQLTVDAQSYVYATNVFYAGETVNDWGEGLWPHAHHLMSGYPLLPGKKAYDYQVTSMGSELELGTFCHENGHMICDFPDLYDYGNQSRGVGDWCLMCSGNHADQKNPTHVGAYLKYRAGWGIPKQLTPGTYEARAGANDFYIHAKSSTEYFIVENRRLAGRDAALPGEGLAIWHVDEMGDQNHEQMTPAEHYECSLEQADGRNELEGLVNGGDPSDMFGAGYTAFSKTTTPASTWWDGSDSGLAISDIGAAGPTIKFKVV